MIIRTSVTSVLSTCALTTPQAFFTLQSAQTGEELMLGQVYSSDKSFHLPSATFSGFPQAHDC